MKNVQWERAMGHWWWVALFGASCFLFHCRTKHHQQELHKGLEGRMEQLQAERLAALSKQGDLLAQIESQNDPAWIEMILMKKSGLVPGGQTKISFQKEEGAQKNCPFLDFIKTFMMRF